MQRLQTNGDKSQWGNLLYQVHLDNDHYEITVYVHFILKLYTKHCGSSAITNE